MGTIQVRSLDQADETRSFPNGAVDEPWVTIDFSPAMVDYAKPS